MHNPTPPSLWVISYAGGENLLLRHSYSDKDERSLVLNDELHTPSDLMLRFYESHRRRVNHKIEARIFFHQHRACRNRRTDNCYFKT